MLRVSVGITTNMKTSATDWIAKNIESLSYTGIWVGEDIGLGQDVFVLTAMLLKDTNSIRIGTGIIPFTTHNISTLARAGVTFQELGRGRFIFGTGIGGIQDLEKLGVEIKRPVTGLRHATNILRRLWNGDSVTIDSELFNLSQYSLELKTSVKIPIFFGVRGPQMLALAGEIADGVILSGPIDYIKSAISIIDESAKRYGREKGLVDKVVWLPTIPTFSGVKESLAKRIVALIIADTPTKIIDMLDVDEQLIQEIVASVRKSGPKNAEHLITDHLLDTFAITGNCEHMVDMFESIIDVGATEVVLGPPFSGDWRGAMKDISDEIEKRGN